MSSTETAAPGGPAEMLTEAEVVALFDRQAQAGRLFFDYAFQTESTRSGGMQVEFRITRALASKPWQTTSALAVPTAPGSAPRPGSDINVSGLDVRGLNGGTHLLTFNMFSSFRPHMLLLTEDGYRRQWEPLDVDDFRAAGEFLGAMDRDYVVFYNCRVEGGCSRVHKHLQAIPSEPFGGDPWVNIDSSAAPFVHHETRFESPPSPEACLEAYRASLALVERELGFETPADGGAPPHNMIMDRRRMVVVPRRAAGVGSLGVNAGCVLGTIWTPTAEKMQEWRDAGVAKVVEACALSKPPN